MLIDLTYLNYIPAIIAFIISFFAYANHVEGFTPRYWLEFFISSSPFVATYINPLLGVVVAAVVLVISVRHMQNTKKMTGKYTHRPPIEPAFNVIEVIRNDSGEVIENRIGDKYEMPVGYKVVSENTYVEIDHRRWIVRELKKE